MAYTYIMTNRPKGTLYIGAAEDLAKACAMHASGELAGPNPKHAACKTLVWYEAHDDLAGAQALQKVMLAAKRSDNTKRIKAQNPKWADMSLGL